jgi:aryl-alcohol dehydrogenase-like predicted oxidoreductase
MLAAFDAGVNWVDTAAVYGGGGGSETIVGEAIADRRAVFVSTKVAPEPAARFRKDGLVWSIEESLRRIGRSSVDLYFLHWSEPSVPIEHSWQGMLELKSRGLARFVGLSNHSPEEISRCLSVGPVDYIQIQGSLLFLDELHTLGGMALDVGTGVLVYGALAFGLIASRIDDGSSFADWRGGSVMADDFFCAENYARFFRPGALARRLVTVHAVHELAAKIHVAPSQLALAYVLSLEPVTSVLAGTRSVIHARENALVPQMMASLSRVRQDLDAIAAAAQAN